LNILKGSIYTELGCTVIDKYDGNISDKVKISGSVDTNKGGRYTITYSVTNSKGVTSEITRTIVVMDATIVLSLDDTKPTNDGVNINVSVSDDLFSYILLPDNNKVYTTTYSYRVTKNGSYTFAAYNTKGAVKHETIEINTIDETKPTGTCEVKHSQGISTITINAKDNNGIEKYIIDGKTYTSNNIVIDKKFDNLNVDVYDKAGNNSKISCDIHSSKMEIHFIPVEANEDAILIRTDDKNIFIDGGSWDSRNTVVSYLKAVGVKKIDALFGSHVHWNHIQTHAAIIDNFEVENLYYPVDILNCVSRKECENNDIKYTKDKVLEKNLKTTVLKPKDKLTLGDMEIYLIGPVRGKYTTWQNASSLVFILKFGENKFMFTGDTPGLYMDAKKFLENASAFNMDIKVDVFKWPHHGYVDDGLEDSFFAAATPKYAIIPRYHCAAGGWPTGKAKKQVEKYGIKTYMVCKTNIVIESDGENITIKTNQPLENYKR